jgi:glycosyltransferase involved in cell wall biosynthesis
MVDPPAARAGVGRASTPRLSVIVPTWNEGKWLSTLLESLGAQTVPPSEIIVADSGSSDETAGIARSAGAIVAEGDRRGPGEGRNRGARAATGEILLFIDADCIPPRNLVESVFLALADSTVVGGATGFVPAAGRGIERALFRLANGYQRAMTLWGWPHNAGYCFFFRKEAFEKLGGIREDMLLNETHDLALRSRALGRFVILPIAVETSMRRFRAYGYFRTVLKEYIGSTILYYATGRTPPDVFRPAPAR